jgi:uncharacterized protein (DUF1800 family)
MPDQNIASPDVSLAPAAIALNRFGLGARPDDVPPKDPKGWLRNQLDAYQTRPPVIAALPNSEAIAIPYFQSRRQANMASDAKAKQTIFAASRSDNRRVYRAAANARIANALATETPFTERLVHFWANHFAISADKVTTVPFVGSCENEAIRPHIMGNFHDLVLAVERHPGMLIYLDQASSIGPQSVMAQRARSRNAPRVPGMNENLAREIMELHTLGVRSGYTQNDVTEFARALTGWSIGGVAAPALEQDVAPGAFIFRPAMHEPGERTIMGRRYGPMGEEQAGAVLRDLVKAPATATHIATKLARHFAGDEPPAALVERLSRAFGDSQGDLQTLYRVLIDSPEAWAPRFVKFKTPWEWAISALRGIGFKTADRLPAPQMLSQLGQSVWEPGSPAGWADIDASWAAPDALVRRVEVANRLATLAADRHDPRELATKLLAIPPSPNTRAAIEGADSPLTGLALLLVSPEFQRR